jgi:mannose-6-phosphate isomerase-like protein (cupin superfamily)
MNQAMRGAKLDEAALLDSEVLAFGGPVPGTEERFQVRFLVNDPRGVIAHEAFLAGSTVSWAFWHDEVHVVLRGAAEVSYTLGPNHRKVVQRSFSAGDTYVIPDGARVTFRIGADEPYVHVCVIMPRFEYARDERTDTYE